MTEYKLNEAEDRYIIPDIGELPRSTVILGKHIDKSAPLMYWSAGMALDYIIESLVSAGDKSLALLHTLASEDRGEVYKKAKAYHKEKSREAMDVGSRVHKTIERIIKAEMSMKDEVKIEISPDIQKPIEAFMSWWEENDVEPLATELTVWGLIDGTELGWAGTLDGLWRVNGVITIDDLKTSTAIYEDHPLQVASYYKALNQMVDKGILDLPKAEATAILRLDKETGMPQYKMWDEKQSELNYLIFSQLCAAYHLIAKSKEDEREAKLKVKLKERMDKKIKAWDKEAPF